MGGRGSAGGSLNLVSKTPKADPLVTVAGALGTADYKRLTVDIADINDFDVFRVLFHRAKMVGRNPPATH